MVAIACYKQRTLIIVNSLEDMSVCEKCCLFHLSTQLYHITVEPHAWLMYDDAYNADESSDKRLEDEVQRYRDLLDEANRQISSMTNMFSVIFCGTKTAITVATTTITTTATTGFLLN